MKGMTIEGLMADEPAEVLTLETMDACFERLTHSPEPGPLILPGAFRPGLQARGLLTEKDGRTYFAGAWTVFQES